MRRALKGTATALSLLLLCVSLVLVGSWVNHREKLSQESELFVPLGEMAGVDGHSMSVYVDGQGPETLVFLAGAGTSSPILDFRSLYSHLVDDHEVVVVERLGYGFSDVGDAPRDVGTVLGETRRTLDVAGITGPFVLVPHSMAVLEAIHWAQKYPGEVSAIVGLDPAVPSAYEDMGLPGRTALSALAWGARVGITRFFPSIVDDSAAIKAGSLTDDEKEIYRAVFYRRTETGPMVEEIRRVRENAAKVNELPPPQVPTLFFTSNGDGIGMDASQWQRHQTDYLAWVEGGQHVVLDAAHYVHDFEHETIAARSAKFIAELERDNDP